MTAFNRITTTQEIMNGQPCIKGTRLTVKRVLLALSQHADMDDLRKDYPQLTEQDVREALAYAACSLNDEIVEFRSAS
jgi:uncharacterized protein (DUF433 family)